MGAGPGDAGTTNNRDSLNLMNWDALGQGKNITPVQKCEQISRREPKLASGIVKNTAFLSS